MRTRMSGAELEREGGIMAAIGAGLGLAGWFLLGSGILAIGIGCLVLGLIMWGAGMARSD